MFCELPKLRGRLPTTDVERWAALFLHAHDLKPADVAGVPLTAAQREALELANEATFSESELDAYRKARDEVQQMIQYGKDKEAQGRARGALEGKLAAKRDALYKIVKARAFTLEDARRAVIEACRDAVVLDAWIDRALVAADVDAVFAARE